MVHLQNNCRVADHFLFFVCLFVCLDFFFLLLAFFVVFYHGIGKIDCEVGGVVVWIKMWVL